jgi:Dehydrogenases with different specificities (related to short-chain alcohol dehydrogenases)
MKKFTEKNCFVTGGANGIGQTIVAAFHAAGATVSFCDIDEDQGQKLADSLPGTHFYPVDVKDVDALLVTMDQAWKAMGGIDIVINNVGLGFFSPLTETSVERFDEALATNLRPVFITSRELARRRDTPEGRKQYGRIINMASTRWLQSEPGTEGYAASKGGIVSLTHALMMSLTDYNITVNCISPGWIDTGHYGALKPEDHAQHPSGRVGVPEDIARTCLFLADPENGFINGQNIVVDGGMTKKMIYIE